MKKKKADTPLTIHVDKDLLVISVGVNVLAEAVFHSTTLEFRDYLYKVINAKKFAKEVADAMQEEEEDGNTPLFAFLDDMVINAIDNGSTAVKQITFEEKVKILSAVRNNGNILRK